MDVLLETPHPPLETSHTFLISAEASEALFIVQALRLSAVYKSTLGARPGLIISIQIYFKYKYTYENAGVCILCIDEFKILQFSNRLSKFSMIFIEKRHRCQPPTPQRPYDVSRGQNRYVTLPLMQSWKTRFLYIKQYIPTTKYTLLNYIYTRM